MNSTEYVNVIQVSRDGELRTSSVLCLFTLHATEVVEFPCVIPGVTLGITDSAVIAEEGVLCKNNTMGWFLGDNCSSPSHFTRFIVQASIENRLEELYFQYIVIDPFSLLEKFFDLSITNTPTSVRAVFSIQSPPVQYPVVHWYGKHLLVESDEFAVGLVNTFVSKQTVLLSEPEWVDDIIIQFQEFNEKKGE